MVNDMDIKSKISPFAMRENEIKVFDGKDGYVGMNQIVKKIDLGHITDIHFKILEIINEFEFITSRQLFQLLTMKNIEIDSQDKLNNKLDQMIKTKMLTRYYFKSDDGQGIFRIYCFEKMGKYLLKSRGIDCNWQPTDNTKPIEMIKKRLAGNQTLIAYLQKVGIANDYIAKPTLYAKKIGKKFKATGGSIKLTKSEKSINFLFEVIRREEDWEKRLVEKMRLYKDFYESFVANDCGFEKKPQLIFVCEDDKHMVEVFKSIVTNKAEIEGIALYFTTDLKQIAENLGKSLIQFKIDDETKKYKMETLDIKLLS